MMRGMVGTPVQDQLQATFRASGVLLTDEAAASVEDVIRKVIAEEIARALASLGGVLLEAYGDGA